MPKYLFKVNMSQDGLRGTLAEGGTSRREMAEQTAENVGGHIEAYYYAFGGTDAFVIGDLPNNEAAAAVAMTVSSSGTGAVETVVLLEPEQINTVAEMTLDYHPPGT